MGEALLASIAGCPSLSLLGDLLMDGGLAPSRPSQCPPKMLPMGKALLVVRDPSQKQESFPRGRLWTNFKFQMKQTMDKRKDGGLPKDRAFVDLGWRGS